MRIWHARTDSCCPFPGCAHLCFFMLPFTSHASLSPSPSPPNPQLVMNLLCTILVHHKSTAVSSIKGPIMTGVLDLIQSPLLQGTAPGMRFREHLWYFIQLMSFQPLKLCLQMLVCTYVYMFALCSIAGIFTGE